MKPISLSIVALIGIALLEGFLFPSLGKAENILDFTQGKNLKVVYDAGLRPWRVRPDETSSLLISKKKLTIIAPTSVSFPFDTDSATFHVLAENELSRVDFYGTPVSLADAEAEVRKLCLALSLPTDGLTEAVASFVKLGTDAPQRYWNVQGKKDGVLYWVTLQPLFGFTKTTGRVNVVFDFHQPGKPMKFLTEPIKPPPGYENLSMEPPPRDPSKKPIPDPADFHRPTTKASST